MLWYNLNELTIPRLGKIFAFKTFDAAKAWLNDPSRFTYDDKRNPIYVLLKCTTRHSISEPIFSDVPSWQGYYAAYWKSIDSYMSSIFDWKDDICTALQANYYDATTPNHIVSIMLPKDTVFCTDVTPTEIISDKEIYGNS